MYFPIVSQSPYRKITIVISKGYNCLPKNREKTNQKNPPPKSQTKTQIKTNWKKPHFLRQLVKICCIEINSVPKFQQLLGDTLIIATKNKHVGINLHVQDLYQESYKILQCRMKDLDGIFLDEPTAMLELCSLHIHL